LFRLWSEQILTSDLGDHDGLNCVPQQIHIRKSQLTLVTQNVILFGDRSLQRASSINEVIRVVLVQYDSTILI
jgi:hypothetical protein